MKKEGWINRVRETETDGWAKASILHGGQPRLTTWYRTQRKKKNPARSGKKPHRRRREFLTFTSRQQYQFTKKQKRRGIYRQGTERQGVIILLLMLMLTQRPHRYSWGREEKPSWDRIDAAEVWRDGQWHRPASPEGKEWRELFRNQMCRRRLLPMS